MRGAIISIGFGIGLLGCAPDLGVNAAQRCTDSLECGPDALCYRGFCVPEEDVNRDAGSDTALIDDGASPPIGAPNQDAGVAPASEATVDAATAAVDASMSAEPATPGPGAADAGAMASTPSTTSTPSSPTASTPSASTPSTSTPSTSTPGASTPNTSTPTTSPTPTTTPTPNTPAQPAKPGTDAGPAKPDAAAPASSQDAGVAEVDLPGHCTVADCCKEARESGPQAARDRRGPGAADGDEDDKTGPKEKKSKECGCADPALIGGILCSWLGPLGVLP